MKLNLTDLLLALNFEINALQNGEKLPLKYVSELIADARCEAVMEIGRVSRREALTVAASRTIKHRKLVLVDA